MSSSKAADFVVSLGRRIYFHYWFLQEQRQEVASMSDLPSVVERAGESNILLADEYLARTPVGDQEAPDAGAPPAAGGAL
jgi:bacterioferritin B